MITRRTLPGACAIAAIVLALTGCAPDSSPPSDTSAAAGNTAAPPSVFPTGCIPAAIGLDDRAYVVQRLVCADKRTEVFVFATQEDRDMWWPMVEKQYDHYKPGQGETWIEVQP